MKNKDELCRTQISIEKENIDTMDSTGELLITILSSQAQEESRNLSENTRWGIVRKYEQGIVQINHNKFMGYTKDVDGNLVVIPEEAAIVKKIFDLYLEGFGISRIAKTLTEQGIKTATGNPKWHSATIHKMLKSEKYIGDAMLQKTYTVDFLSKKRVINDGIVKRYYVKNNHEPIITREQYAQVQEELKRRNNKANGGVRYSSKYSISGLIFCGHCGKPYSRTVWFNKHGDKLPVWRCKQRIKKGGYKKCSNSQTLRNDMIYSLLSDTLNSILNIDISTASAFELQTKAEILKAFNSQFILREDVENMVLRSIIDSIIARPNNQLEFRFKTGLTINNEWN